MTDQMGRDDARRAEEEHQDPTHPDPWRGSTQHKRHQTQTDTDPLAQPDRYPASVCALRIDPDATSSRLDLPTDQAAQHNVLRSLIGGSTDRAVYHRNALLHVHGNGAGMRLPVNPAAWALACAWRGLDLPYLLHGPVIVTGPDTHGVLQTLSNSLLAQAEEVARRAEELRLEWSTRPPVSEPAARQELLAYTRRATHPT